ncbi:MAG: ABC transporter permease, partial [Thermoleophilia bacterium]
MTGEAIDRGRSRGAEHRGPTQDWRGLAWRQYRLERKMFWRNPSAAFFNFLLPLLLLALFGAVFAGRREDLDVIVPGIAGVSVMAATFVALAYNLTFLRERGILKRLRGTPLASSAYLAGIAANAVMNTVLQ